MVLHVACKSCVCALKLANRGGMAVIFPAAGRDMAGQLSARPVPIGSERHFHTGHRRRGWPVPFSAPNAGQERDFLNPQAVDDDMHMNVAAVVMPVRVGAYLLSTTGKCCKCQTPGQPTSLTATTGRGQNGWERSRTTKKQQIFFKTCCFH